ncbi:hypothetical protein ACYSNR_05955 [Enterococcus sp. LJL128]
MFKKNEQAQVVEWEKIAAKQIKKEFSDIQEIRFSEKYNYNHLAGFVSIGAEIITEEVQDSIGFTLPTDETNLGSYGGGTNLKKGETTKKVQVIYTDKSKGTI